MTIHRSSNGSTKRWIFVMSKIARTVGTRALGPQAPVEYELPREAVTETIVNAVTQR